MSSDPNPLLLPDQPDRPWWWDWQALLVSLLVVGIYSIRLTHAPVCGEESRWATMAKEMIASGTLIVGSHNLCHAMGRPEITRVLKSYDHTFAILRDALDKGDIAERLGGATVAPMVRAS